MTTPRERDVVMAATMYYLQDMKMETIARHLRTSRSTVSRLLKRARETGVVEITLRPTHTRAPGLGQRLAAQYDIDTYVVPVPDAADDAQRLGQVARTTARLVTRWFDSDMVLGIAWGTTLAAVAGHLMDKPTRGSAVVQLNGAANNRTSGVAYAGDLLDRIAATFEAHAHPFPVPAFFDFAETRDAMWRERSVRRVLDVQARTDLAVFSVGALTGGVPSHVYSAGYLEPEDVAALEGAGVVGDVCTVFLRPDGSFRDIAINARATGPTPDQLRRFPRRLCAAAGDNKIAPLRAALAAGVVTDLVVDEITAAGLVEAD
ncbi:MULTISPECIES: sugar-binding transcriptional regulator [Isoptericola]|uniref:Transcriptional regulator n=1 Tax=Isoptericola sediminis TaxID=2733572 RepID=A0A849K1F8_9MICO|nr:MULTISPECIES: sugar-binding domain-containing protein [unclassified Isoptericola]MDO8143278.1 sugar-binding domain-containing protein [Isoptericola sp. 178]MDO8147139.1 sugar-binding domain-containing protein [Isoptericola sp. b515]MDO8150546.1 sugar-binding domain-containing protein [Isoptericola sp. b408]NNU26521.1 transcriptional regulator [Isoptericola sediminis]